MLHFCNILLGRQSDRKRAEYGDEAEEEEMAVAPLKYEDLLRRLVVFLVKFSRFAHRPSSPVVFAGVNNWLHHVGLSNKSEREWQEGKKRDKNKYNDVIKTTSRSLSVYTVRLRRIKLTKCSFFCFSLPFFDYYFIILHGQNRIERCCCKKIQFFWVISNSNMFVRRKKGAWWISMEGK